MGNSEIGKSEQSASDTQVTDYSIALDYVDSLIFCSQFSDPANFNEKSTTLVETMINTVKTIETESSREELINEMIDLTKGIDKYSVINWGCVCQNVVERINWLLNLPKEESEKYTKEVNKRRSNEML